MARAHGWLLTAPWWHWPRQGATGTPPDQTSPVLQKYATPAFGTELITDPQRRLRFTEVDVAPPPRYGASAALPIASPQEGVRKLYLPAHHRHYLVLTELHCDLPGLPSPGRDQVCEAGFVVRRRSVEVPSEAAGEARRLLRQVTLARAQLGAVNRKIGRVGRANGVARARHEALRERRDAALRKVSERETGLREWAMAAGVRRSLQGWLPLGAADGAAAPVPLPERPEREPGLRPLPGLGRWAPVAELPAELTEATFPLYPLIADPGDPGHDAAGFTIFFGVVPTVSADLDLPPLPAKTARTANAGDAAKAPRRVPDRSPRFGEFDLYEIRCFVRQHDPHCPRRAGRRDCHGKLYWSEPTEAYRLAGHLDPRGTANRPITITMPDLAELRAQAPGLVGMGGMRVQTPPGSQLDVPGGPGGDGFQICSFMIPLITIIAMFVLKLFLPVVVFLFQLWWMLALKLCIPPSVEVDGGLAADIEAKGPAFELDAQLKVEVLGKLGLGVPNLTANLVAAAGSLGVDTSDEEMTGGITDAVVDPNRDAADRFPTVQAVLATTGLVSPDDDLLYEARVEREEVFAT